jgi:tRNA(Ile)-lysidine synthase
LLIMIEKIKHTIAKYNLLQPNERVLLALSGGPDSTALAVTLAQIAPAMGVKLLVAHFNHGLRGRESDRDERQASRLAKQLGLSFVSRKMNKAGIPKGLSPEDFYRRQRYLFLDEVAKSNHAHKIALGHNLQDQSETVLLHLLRGSGLEGLKGIVPLRDGKYIRPLIEVSREEILAFLDEAGIAYWQDSSNESKLHLRNKVRLELLPYLRKEYNPKIDEALAQMAEIIREENILIKECVDKALKSTCVKKQKSKILLNIEYLNMLPLAIQRRLLKELLENFSLQKNGITFLHINSIGKLLHNLESGRKICLPFGIEARREYENLVLERSKECAKLLEYSYHLDIPCEVLIRERKLTVRLQIVKKDKIDFNVKNKDYFDLDKIKFPLFLRNRREGDWFQPLGMAGRQKLKSFFINHKITQQKRNEIMLLANQQAVIWIENMHLNDQVKITPETKNVLELEII